ncbi:MAG: ribulose-phosphate 3-epimerase [Thermoplasmata archaeon]
MIKISPSILSADFSRLGEEVKRAERGGADYIHIDVMDGVFVPNLTIGPPVISSLRPVTKLPFDVHLMIQRPGRFAKDFVRAGADILTIHLEAEEEVEATLDAIRKMGARPGISIKPATTFEAVKPFMGLVDILLIMTVEPGLAGQQFMMDILPKLEEARGFIEEGGLEVELEVDGGINEVTAGLAAKAGARVLVAGSAIYGGNVRNRISKIRNSASNALG